jgi:hypothetical protein
MVMPGDNITVDVELITPDRHGGGLRFAIREGGKTVGAGVVCQDQHDSRKDRAQETLFAVQRAHGASRGEVAVVRRSPLGS